MEVKVLIDLTDRTLEAINKLTSVLTGAKVEASAAMEEKPAKSTKTVKTAPAKVVEPAKEEPAKEEPTEAVEAVEETKESIEIDEAALRAKVAEGTAAGLKDQIKAYLKENFKTLKLAELDSKDCAKVYNAVEEMLIG